MRRRPVVTILMLIIAMILPLPLRAQQRIVAPTFRSAGADLKVCATTAISSPAKPFTQEQVSNMVRAGLGDDSGAKLIEQRGIDFAPSEDFCQSLKAAGASEAFLNALRAAVADVAPGLSLAHADVAASVSVSRRTMAAAATGCRPQGQVYDCRPARDIM